MQYKFQLPPIVRKQGIELINKPIWTEERGGMDMNRGPTEQRHHRPNYPKVRCVSGIPPPHARTHGSKAISYTIGPTIILNHCNPAKCTKNAILCSGISNQQNECSDAIKLLRLSTKQQGSHEAYYIQSNITNIVYTSQYIAQHCPYNVEDFKFVTQYHG